MHWVLNSLSSLTTSPRQKILQLESSKNLLSTEKDEEMREMAKMELDELAVVKFDKGLPVDLEAFGSTADDGRKTFAAPA